jgi:glycosyltransferase involved in cell wall biosynthesis
MHLVFLSTLYEPPWGGSENLWSGAAMCALEQGHRVSVFVSEREKLETPLERLKAAGAKLYFWKPKYLPLNFLQRIVKKLSGRKLPQWEWWHRNIPQDADVICVSQGGVFCALKFHGLAESVESSNRPYVLLARCDTGIEFFNERTRARMKEFFEKAAAFVTASQSTIDQLRLYLPSKLENARVLHSPLADYGEAADSGEDLTTKDTNRHEKGEEDLTTDSTDGHGYSAGLVLAGQAGAAFSNPFTSELARDSENTSLNRSAIGPAEALRASEGSRSEIEAGVLGSVGGNQLDDSERFLEGQSQACLQMEMQKSQNIREANAPDTSGQSSSSVSIREIRGEESGETKQVPCSATEIAPEAHIIEMACVGRLRVGDKGQHLLLAALAEEPWRSRPYRLSFHGEGPDRKYLEELVVFYGLGEKVHFAGHTKDVGEIWKRSHLALQPSFVEGAPQSLLEAMLCRRPCVATAVSGIPEWVEEGKTGFLAEAPTVHHLRLALERAWENRHRWAEMGKAARVACLAKRDPDPAGTLLRLLAEATKQPRTDS